MSAADGQAKVAAVATHGCRAAYLGPASNARGVEGMFSGAVQHGDAIVGRFIGRLVGQRLLAHGADVGDHLLAR